MQQLFGDEAIFDQGEESRAIAGVAGLMLAIPILGIVMVLGETLEIILTDTRLQARHRYSQKLRWRAANRDLNSD